MGMVDSREVYSIKSFLIQRILFGSCDLSRIWGSVFVLLSPICRIGLPNIMTHMFSVTIIDYICNVNYIISELHLQILHCIWLILPPHARNPKGDRLLIPILCGKFKLWRAKCEERKKRLCVPVAMLAVIHTNIHLISSVVLHSFILEITMPPFSIVPGKLQADFSRCACTPFTVEFTAMVNRGI